MVPPPAPAAPAAVPAKSASGATSVALVNAGFETIRRGTSDVPAGWFLFQHAGPRSYTYVVDGAQQKSGERSMRLDNIGPEFYGAIAQKLDARLWKGKVARFSGWVKTADVNPNGAVLTLLASKGSETIAHNFMLDALITGTTDWKRYTISLLLPQDTNSIEVGVMLHGKGSVWLDDVELEIIEP